MTTPQTPVGALMALVTELVAGPTTDYERSQLAAVEACARALAAIPEGFVLVPMEASDEMYEAFRSINCSKGSGGMEEFTTFRGDFGNWLTCYQAMLAAAPTTPTAPAQDAQGVDGADEINSPFNACMFRDKCRSMLAALRASSPADTRNALRADHPLARGQCIHNVPMSKHCGACSPKEPQPGAIISGYTITEGFDGVKVERAQQMAGPAKWAVRRSGNVLSRSGEWDWEPTPSSRTHEWLSEHRFDTASEAIDAAHGIVTKEST